MGSLGKKLARLGVMTLRGIWISFTFIA